MAAAPSSIEQSHFGNENKNKYFQLLEVAVHFNFQLLKIPPKWGSLSLSHQASPLASHLIDIPPLMPGFWIDLLWLMNNWLSRKHSHNRKYVTSQQLRSQPPICGHCALLNSKVRVHSHFWKKLGWRRSVRNFLRSCFGCFFFIIIILI